MDRESNIEIFEDTCNLLRSNAELKSAWQYSLAHSQFVGEEEEIACDVQRFQSPCSLVVSRDRTFQAARKHEGHVCVLNFASANNPGGGVKSGCRAQEESLCRISTLYPCLANARMQEKFYEPHHALTFLHNDDLIYSPDVVVFKSDEDYPRLLEGGSWFKTDVITCAAPNLGGVFITDDELEALHEKRMKKILCAAASHEVDALVLGAFGCGAFHNEPRIVALAMEKAIKPFRHAFKAIEFAIACLPGDDLNYRVFREVFG